MSVDVLVGCFGFLIVFTGCCLFCRSLFGDCCVGLRRIGLGSLVCVIEGNCICVICSCYWLVRLWVIVLLCFFKFLFVLLWLLVYLVV